MGNVYFDIWMSIICGVARHLRHNKSEVDDLDQL